MTFVNEFRERYIECPSCRVKFVYDITRMRGLNKKTWPVFECPQESCSKPIIEYREMRDIKDQDVMDRMLRLLYRNYSSAVEDVSVVKRENEPWSSTFV